MQEGKTCGRIGRGTADEPPFMEVYMPKLYLGTPGPIDWTHDPLDDICNNLKARRQQLDISAASMAEALGVSDDTYRGYESGRRKIPINTLVWAAQALDCTPNDLIYGDKQENDHFASVKVELAAVKEELAEIRKVISPLNE